MGIVYALLPAIQCHPRVSCFSSHASPINLISALCIIINDPLKRVFLASFHHERIHPLWHNIHTPYVSFVTAVPSTCPQYCGTAQIIHLMPLVCILSPWTHPQTVFHHPYTSFFSYGSPLHLTAVLWMSESDPLSEPSLRLVTMNSSTTMTCHPHISCSEATSVHSTRTSALWSDVNDPLNGPSLHPLCLSTFTYCDTPSTDKLFLNQSQLTPLKPQRHGAA